MATVAAARSTFPFAFPAHVWLLSWLWQGLLPVRVSGICDERRHLSTDGYTFKFTLSVQFHVPDGVASSILSSSTGAFELRREATNYLNFTVFTDSGGEGGQVTSGTQLSNGAWWEIAVEKHLGSLCVQVNALAVVCSNNAIGSSRMKDVGELIVATDGAEVKEFSPLGAAHAQMYVTSGAQLFHYYLVGIADGKSGVYNPARDDYADASDPALGDYVKPKYGTFTRLRYECGYQLGGVLGLTEISGNWTWDVLTNGGLLQTQADPVALVSNNVVRQPNLPGYVGHAHPAAYWSNYNNNFHPSFGLGAWSAVDGRYHANNIFTCEPSRGTDIFPPDWTRWSASPTAGDTNRYVRIWLGMEVEAGTVTTTTTGTCTTTTSTTSSSSSSSSTSTTTETTTTSSSSSSSSKTAMTTTSSSSSSTSRSTSTRSTTSISTTSMTTASSTTATSSLTSTTSSSSGTSTITYSTTTMSTTTMSTTTYSTTGTTTVSSTTSTSSSITSTSSSSGTSTTTHSTTITSTTTFSSTSTTTVSSTTTTTSLTSSTSTTSGTSTTTYSATSTSTTTHTTTSTTSVSSTTATSSSTSSTSTSSSTSTITVDQRDVLGWISAQEDALVGLVLSDPNADARTVRAPGAVMTALRVTEPKDLSFEVEGTQASVTLRGAMFAKLGQETLVVVATVVDPDLAAKVGGAPAVAAAIELSLYNSARAKVAVERLEPDEKVLLTFPVNRSAGVSCGYWDEGKGVWSNRGMQEVLPDDGDGDDHGLLVCSSAHLTFFGAVLDGFLSAFACAQLGLLSLHAIEQWLKLEWWYQPVALTFWIFEITLVLMLALACILDYHRECTGAWEDEFFLIPDQRPPAEAEAEGGAEAGAGAGEAGEAGEAREARSAVQRVRAACGAVAACILVPFSYCCQSDACRDALDGICSRWFAYFGEVRSCLEDTCAGFQLSQGGCSMISSITSGLLHSSVRRQVSASLSLSEEAVSFYVEDEELSELLRQAAAVSAELEGQSSQPTKWQRRQLAWLAQHDKIVKQFDRHWSETRWLGLPITFLRLGFVANPLTAPYLHCIFMKSSMRMLFFIIEICGELMILTVFYEASTTVAGQDPEPECLNERNFGQDLGRILAIVFASELFGTVPVIILNSLHSRSFKKFPFEGCPEWQRQLAAWRVQDRVIWVVGLAYTLFSSFFVSLFLANVHPTETATWGIAGSFTFAEDVFVIPFAISLLLPIITAVALSFAACFHGVPMRDYLTKKRRELEDKGGNWKPLREEAVLSF